MARPEPVDIVKARRDTALETLVNGVPYIRFLGVTFDRRGDELTAVLPYSENHIGNAALPAIHGGVTASFLEIAAIIQLNWSLMWDQMEKGEGPVQPRLPKTIDFTIDYLRSGLPRDAYARARIIRSGRRYATVHVEGWQDNRDRLFAQATAHFLLPDPKAAKDG